MRQYTLEEVLKGDEMMILYSKQYLEEHKMSCFTLIEKMKLIKEAIEKKQIDEDTTEEKLKATFNVYFKELQRQKKMIESYLSYCEEYQTNQEAIGSIRNIKEIEQFKDTQSKWSRTTKGTGNFPQ